MRTIKGKEAENWFYDLKPHEAKVRIKERAPRTDESVATFYEDGTFIFKNKNSLFTWEGINTK